MSDLKLNPLIVEAFREHRSRLQQFLRRRLANDDDAQELAQEAFLRLLRVSRSQLVVDPQAYLFRIARNLVYERSARASGASTWVDDRAIEGLEDTGESPEAAAERTAVSKRLESVVAELSPRHRAILLLFCQGGLSQREISEQVGVSKSMVQKCLAQSLAFCRKRLRIRDARAREDKGVRK